MFHQFNLFFYSILKILLCHSFIIIQLAFIPRQDWQEYIIVFLKSFNICSNFEIIYLVIFFIFILSNFRLPFYERLSYRIGSATGNYVNFIQYQIINLKNNVILLNCLLESRYLYGCHAWCQNSSEISKRSSICKRFL